MNMVPPALNLVEMFFTLQVHQVEFVDQAEPFQELDGTVDGGAIDARLALASQIQKSGGIQVLLGALNNFDHSPALGRHPNSLGSQFVQQNAAIKGRGHSAANVATESQMKPKNVWLQSRQGPFTIDSQ